VQSVSSVFGALTLGLVFSGCGASLQAESTANVEIATEQGDQSEGAAARRFGEAQAEVLASDPQAGDAQAVSPPGTALLGARHDLKLGEGGKRIRCACVMAALGQASDPAFVWSSETAKTDPNLQLTLALSFEGSKCEGEPAASLGASYWGFRWDGSDLIVLLESASSGKPITSGAVLPRPTGNGQVYLAPIDPQLPYGKALNGSGERCKLGNPGAPQPRRE